MAFLNELNNEDCGCDNNHFSVINDSPLLSGSQENNFDPSNNSNNVMNYNNSNNSNNLNNNNNNNMYANNNNKMNSLNNSELQQILSNSNNNMQNNNQISEQQIQNILNSIPNTNKRNSNQLPDIGAMRNNKEQVELNNQLNNIVNSNNLVDNSIDQTKYISTMFNYVVVLLVALALNDLAKYYINRSIKFQNGSHMYYVYYSVGLVIVLYIISKYTNNL